MSIKAALVVNRGNRVFDRLPDDTTTSIFEFLKGEKGSFTRSGDDRAVIATAAVCRSWQGDLILNQERKEASTRLRQHMHLKNVHIQMIERDYPPNIVELFRSCNLDIWQLPVLDVKVRSLFLPETQQTLHEIDYEDISKENMTSPIMRLQIEDRRPGIALHVQTVAERVIQLAGQKIRFSGRDEILIVYKANSDPADQRWEYAWKTQEGILTGQYKNDQDEVMARISLLFAGQMSRLMGFLPSGCEVDFALLSQILSNRSGLYKIFSRENPEQRFTAVSPHVLCKKSMVVGTGILTAFTAIYLKSYFES